MSRWFSDSDSKASPSSQHGSAQKLNILMILTGGFIVLVAVLAWFALDRIKAKTQTAVGDALQIVRQTTQESLSLWVESNKNQLARLARDPYLATWVQRQLTVPPNRQALKNSIALPELRNFFDSRGNKGFFIIAPNLVNIASMRDENIGFTNLIATQRLDLLQRAFKGETVWVPPIESDVALDPSSNDKQHIIPTMFFAAPIKNEQGDIIAVVTQHIDPFKDFTRVVQLGRIGQSGETYAFDKYGRLLSKSRFDDDLRKIGLIGKDQRSILTITLRDPGGNMLKGFEPQLPRHMQPLTFVAEQALKKQPGVDVAGHRDYRGVPVFSNWMWDNDLGIGLVSEIERAEALSNYRATRAVILTVLGITVLLALGSILLALLIDMRANRALQKSHDELELRVEERTAELKENQVRLEQAEEHSRLLLESAHEGIFGVGADGLVNFINPAGVAMLGFEANELIGQKIHPLIHHSRPDGSPYPIEECPMHHSLTEGTIGNRDDEVLWHKDGTSFHVEYTSVPIRKNGSIAGTVVVFRDISERKQAEKALRTSRATARGLLDATQESLLLLDKEGIVIAVNQTAARRHRKTPEELIGNNQFNILPKALHESRKAHFDSVLQTGKPADFEDMRDGMVFHNIYYPVQDKSGAIIGVAIFAQDITERKHMEKELMRNVEELEQFYKLAIGREIKMIQLKEEINELLDQLGQGEKYEIVK